MLSTLTKTQICNMALDLVGAKNISDFSTDPGSGDSAKNNWDRLQYIYPTVLDEILSLHPWSFAQRRISLTNISNPTDTPDTWVTATAYVVGDYVVNSSINYVCIVAHTSGTFSTDLNTNSYWVPAAADLPITEDGVDNVYHIPSGFVRAFKISTFTAFHLESLLINSTSTQVIVAGASTLKMIYIYHNDDPTTYFPLFVRTLVTRIAAEMAKYVTESKTSRKQLLEEYKEIKEEAESVDSQQQGTPEQVSQGAWEFERGSGGGGIFPPYPGASTWHTVFWG